MFRTTDRFIVAALAFAFAMFSAALVFGAERPYTLHLAWEDGMTERIPATTEELCVRAAAALTQGRWVPVGRAGHHLAAYRCASGNAFAPGWDCIEGYNCGAHR